MKLIYVFFILLLLILLYFLKTVNENFKIGCDMSIQCLSPMYLPNVKKNIYTRKDKQRPWFKKWSNHKHNLKCYINKHLQRKCYWSCKNLC